MIDVKKKLTRCGGSRSVRLAGALVSIVLAGCAEIPATRSEVQAAPHSAVADALGIEVDGIRLSAAGYMLDFRYRVLDPDKAAPLLDRKIRPYLLDSASGAKLAVPGAPKVGSLRTTSRSKIAPGRSYYILFANPGRYVRAGSKVTLVAGEARIHDLAVD